MILTERKIILAEFNDTMRVYCYNYLWVKLKKINNYNCKYMDLVNARLRKYIPISPMTQTTLKTTIQHSEINFGFFPVGPDNLLYTWKSTFSIGIVFGEMCSFVFNAADLSEAMRSSGNCFLLQTGLKKKKKRCPFKKGISTWPVDGILLLLLYI